ncbi:uncharacterized protein LOC125941310 [Dermacentor silvarum]|uniref:uncharacterized protein LOC125941310 n=1 Tax=Dermacentor silvarum TaxID=543639 RepID=UPI002100D46A|nr:uncharacterized protein LOC125941310 [Dermacentor silvarum]
MRTIFEIADVRGFCTIACNHVVTAVVVDIFQVSTAYGRRRGASEVDRDMHQPYRIEAGTTFETADACAFVAAQVHYALACNDRVVIATVDVIWVSTGRDRRRRASDVSPAYGRRRGASEVDRDINQAYRIESGTTFETADACAFVAAQDHYALACDDRVVIATVDVFWVSTGRDRRRRASDVSNDVDQPLRVGAQANFATTDVRACVAEQVYLARVWDQVFSTIVDALKSSDRRRYETSAAERDVDRSDGNGAQITFGTVDLDFVEVFRISASRRRETCPVYTLRGVPSGRPNHYANSPSTGYLQRHPGLSAVTLSRRGRRLREPRVQPPRMTRREQALFGGSFASIQRRNTGPPSASPQRRHVDNQVRPGRVVARIRGTRRALKVRVSEEATECEVVPVKVLALGWLLTLYAGDALRRPTLITAAVRGTCASRVARQGSLRRKAPYRLLVRYSTTCRIVLSKTPPASIITAVCIRSRACCGDLARLLAEPDICSSCPLPTVARTQPVV